MYIREFEILDYTRTSEIFRHGTYDTNYIVSKNQTSHWLTPYGQEIRRLCSRRCFKYYNVFFRRFVTLHDRICELQIEVNLKNVIKFKRFREYLVEDAPSFRWFQRNGHRNNHLKTSVSKMERQFWKRTNPIKGLYWDLFQNKEI